VLEQAAVFSEQGYQEIVITGINVGKYGLDLEEEQSIYSLLDRLLGDFPTIRFRLSSIEPTEVNHNLLSLFQQHANLMPHLHVPMQSGDRRILQGMNRRYSPDDFHRAIRAIHQALPYGAIGCDVLAGFPGEDEAAHRNSYSLLADLPVTYLHVFPYSRRPGTLADEMKDQLPKATKDKWVAELRELGEQKKAAFYTKELGTRQKVLLERRSKRKGMLQGLSENYIPVHLPAPSSLLRQVVPVRLRQFVDGELLAELEIDE
jgi:threonylcarbamoyladenosine tRNA methylthiotransferase MtaB